MDITMLTEAAYECMSPCQIDAFEALFADADLARHYANCVRKRLSAAQPDERAAFEKTLSVEDSFRQADGTYLNPDVQAVWTANRTASSTAGMTLGERIAHVGGRENANGYIEFGSVMAVDALIQHVLRDAARATRKAEIERSGEGDAR